MFYKLRQKLNYFKINSIVQPLLSIKPSTSEKLPFILLSQLSEKDFYLYILAYYSLTEQYTPQSVFLLDDGTLETWQKDYLLNLHEDTQIKAISEYCPDPFPPRQTLERLVAISELVKSTFVIQMDADILVNGDICEVRKAILGNQSFILGGPEKLSGILTVSEISQHMQTSKSDHVQVQAEKLLHSCPLSWVKLYMRGCSAFAGFSKNSITSQQLTEAWDFFYKELQASWKQWGSEQVLSNLLLANSNAVALPYPKYSSLFPELEPNRASLIHFIGSNRFSNNVYFDLSSKLVNGLLSK